MVVWLPLTSFGCRGATNSGWTSFRQEKDSLGRFGPDRCRLAASAQIRHDLVRDFAICASENPSELRAVDASDASLQAEFGGC